MKPCHNNSERTILTIRMRNSILCIMGVEIVFFAKLKQHFTLKKHTIFFVTRAEIESFYMLV